MEGLVQEMPKIKRVSLECSCEKCCVKNCKDRNYNICDICSEKDFLRKSSTILIAQSTLYDE